MKNEEWIAVRFNNKVYTFLKGVNFIIKQSASWHYCCANRQCIIDTEKEFQKIKN